MNSLTKSLIDRFSDGTSRSHHPGAAAGFGDVWRGAIARSRLARPVGSIVAGLGCCLMYHRICPDESDYPEAGVRFDPNRELRVDVSAFDAQMRFLSQHCNCLALPEAVELLRTGRLPSKSVVVTFDDGYLDNLTLALPILRTHQVPATVYVTTGIIENTASLWWAELEHLIANSQELRIRQGHRVRHIRLDNADARQRAFNELNRQLKTMQPAEQDEFMDMLRQQTASSPFNYAEQVLNRQQLLELASDPLITIGAHTHHHPVLGRLPDIRMRHEINRSRELLERWLSRPIEHLAYPFGGDQHAGEREFRVARELGFTSAVTTRTGHFHEFHRNYLCALPRIAIGMGDSMERFEWKLGGFHCLSRRPGSRIHI